MLLS
ncbi:hypothetical protein MAR_013158 [Mya arenaria]|jgi:macrophage erythroblast attacher